MEVILGGTGDEVKCPSCNYIWHSWFELFRLLKIGITDLIEHGVLHLRNCTSNDIAVILALHLTCKTRASDYAEILDFLLNMKRKHKILFNYSYSIDQFSS